MASINLYKKITKADQLNTEGGYKNVVLWAPVDTFTLLQKPSASAASGDTLKISTAHTFPEDEGFISWLCKLHSVTITGETTGDPGARSIIWKCKFTLLGDDASTQEQLQNMLNDSCIFLLKDGACHATEYVQLGDECAQPDAAVTFDGKTTLEGLKEYTVELTMKAKKYFYSSTVTEKPLPA